MEQIKGLVTLIEEAIENGATSVEEVHRQIANMPLDALRNVEPLGSTVEKVQDIQDRTIGNIYDTIRMVNAQVSEMAKSMLDKADQK